jgi:V-type H+-transporting ATPase subunit E
MDESRQRSRLLGARDEFIQKLIVEAKARLATVASSNASAYNSLLKDLIKQSLVRLEGEETAEVHCRPQDLAAAQKAASTAASELKSESKRSIAVTVVADKDLGGRAGGVVVWAAGGRIKCNNTLEDRLALVVADLTPVIRDLTFPSARAEVRTKPPVHFAHLEHKSAPKPAAPAPAPAAAAAGPKAAGSSAAADPFGAF